VITRVPALRQRIRCGLAFKIRTRYVVKQNLVLDCKQLAGAPRQVGFDRCLVHDELVESAIKAILVDLLFPELQQVAERRAPEPVLGNVQLTRWLTQTRCHQHSSDLFPGDALLACGQQVRTQLRQPHAAPQCQSQINVAKLA
jgi:hypothetical protein